MPEAAVVSFGWLSVVPPVLAITLAIATRQVVLSLLGGVWIGHCILAGFDPATEAFHPISGFFGATRGTIDELILVFKEAWQTRVVLFTLAMGSLLMLMQRSGGVEGFVNWVSQWGWARTRRGAQLMAWVVGVIVFVESTITCLVVGTVSRPLFDKLRISREKLAYICDSTSAPVCILLPINGWGATVLGLLAVQAAAGRLGDTSPLGIFLMAVPLNFYAIITVLMVVLVALTGYDIGPMREAERRAREEGKLMRDGAMPMVDDDITGMPTKPGIAPSLLNMMLPLVAMVVMVPLGILITGAPGWTAVPVDAAFNVKLMGLLNEASGSLAVLWGVSFGLFVAFLLFVIRRVFSVHETIDLIFKGAGGMVALAAIMMMAFAIGTVCKSLGTGDYVASIISDWLPAALVPAVVFLVSCFIAFATGTSWGTFAIMIPLAVPLAFGYQAAGEHISMALVVSAVLGGGVFGDHCSPISDTTLVSSMAAACDHIDHVRTQLPYALVAGGLTVAIYLVLGFAL